jgi:hypothetical protein
MMDRFITSGCGETFRVAREGSLVVCADHIPNNPNPNHSFPARQYINAGK